jgi:hypothetical protein
MAAATVCCCLASYIPHRCPGRSAPPASRRQQTPRPGPWRTARLEAACAKAVAAGDPTYRTVLGILAAGAERDQVPAAQIRGLAALRWLAAGRVGHPLRAGRGRQEPHRLGPGPPRHPLWGRGPVHQDEPRPGPPGRRPRRPDFGPAARGTHKPRRPGLGRIPILGLPRSSGRTGR